jgi:hypothetical protein
MVTVEEVLGALVFSHNLLMDHVGDHLQERFGAFIQGDSLLVELSFVVDLLQALLGSHLDFSLFWTEDDVLDIILATEQLIQCLVMEFNLPSLVIEEAHADRIFKANVLPYLFLLDQPCCSILIKLISTFLVSMDMFRQHDKSGQAEWFEN